MKDDGVRIAMGEAGQESARNEADDEDEEPDHRPLQKQRYMEGGYWKPDDKRVDILDVARRRFDCKEGEVVMAPLPTDTPVLLTQDLQSIMTAEEE